MGSYLSTMTTGGLTIDDMNDPACVGTTSDDDSQSVPTIPQPATSTPAETSVALLTNAFNEASMSEEAFSKEQPGNTANFEDLPMEILIMIAEILFDRYQKTRIKDTNGDWWSINFPDHDVDASFFSARRLSKAMREASRLVFFSDKDLATHWLSKGIDTMEKRIYKEEKYAVGVVNNQNYRNWPCRLCGLARCLTDSCAKGIDQKPHWIGVVYEATRKSLVEVYRDYIFTTYDDPEMLFKKGFCFGSERKLNRHDDWYTALHLVRIRDEEGNHIKPRVEKSA